ncbi:UNVERIFIED_CONTAM: hypothetical protein Sradi_4162900 [Sesamum radiatum]|uniref:Aminotransferase-like plant mobile domain-containing protein n=1 Tax=Sesamum radiatum TaxID=300843 RepID=A0AAW2P2Q2_SESRA
MSLLVTNHQTTSPIYALWAVLSLKVMQSGMAIFVLPENFAIPKDIGSGLRTCLADVEIDCAISKYMVLFMLHSLLMTKFRYRQSVLRSMVPSYKYFAYFCREMSISLWDLHELVGLPMTGCLYDEVVPKKKTVRPKSTHNPLGDIATHERWSTTEDALFAKLCIERSLKEEVYLAAYLACWLCLFVLPGNDVNSIRPSTFKMASLMANGRRVNLAIPVLASIYEGLNTIATSPKPAGTSHSFPIHFVYAWLACYFKTHYSVWQELRGPKMTRFSGEGGAKYYEPREARKRIHKAEFVSWACNMLVKAEPFKFVDDGRAEELDHSYFVAIRSSYLTLRRGCRFIVEPYSPHRFGRQFGYYQDVPGTLRYDTRVASLEEGSATGAYVFLSKSSSKAWFPCLPANAKKLCSEAYKAWWAKIHGAFFDDNIACLIRPKSIKITLKRKKDEGKQVDGGENDPPHALIPPIVIECDSQAAVVEASKGKCSFA